MIFGIVNVVPIDLYLVFQVGNITRLFFGCILFGSHSFLGQSLLLSTVLPYLMIYNCVNSVEYT